jgi:hypothetical protein
MIITREILDFNVIFLGFSYPVGIRAFMCLFPLPEFPIEIERYFPDLVLLAGKMFSKRLGDFW